MAGKARKNSPPSAIVASAWTAFDRAQPAQGFDGVEPHVEIGIVERPHQGGNRARIAAFAQNQRRLHAQVGIVAGETANHRLDDVEIGDGQQVEGAAEHAEIVMLLAQRPDERVDDRRPLPGQLD